jgi:hypothetical protein
MHGVHGKAERRPSGKINDAVLPRFSRLGATFLRRAFDTSSIGEMNEMLVNKGKKTRGQYMKKETMLIYLFAFLNTIWEMFLMIFMSFLPICIILLQAIYENIEGASSLHNIILLQIKGGELFMTSAALLSSIIISTFKRRSLDLKYISIVRYASMVILLFDSISFMIQRNNKIQNLKIFINLSIFSLVVTLIVLFYVNFFKELKTPAPTSIIRDSEKDFTDAVKEHRGV